MKRFTKSLFLTLFVAGTFFQSCSTDVDLYADYKEITVVYGLLDINQDTNFVKITKAFLGPGNALLFAKEPDSNNFPGKLDARLVEMVNGHTQREIILDTMTVHDKEDGVFYAPNQLVYYTTEAIHAGSVYELIIKKGGDEEDITSSTGIVGGNSFQILNRFMNFSSTSSKSAVSFSPADNAHVYEVVMKFHYKETLPGQATTDECMIWSLGMHSITELALEQGIYNVPYQSDAFFKRLGTDIGADTLNVDRVIGDFEICVSAGGQELYNYITVNSPSSSVSQNVTDFSNVNGGYGVYSSRVNIVKVVTLSGQTIPMLMAKNWGFRQE
jgi:hypothetical protein